MNHESKIALAQQHIAALENDDTIPQQVKMAAINSIGLLFTLEYALASTNKFTQSSIRAPLSYPELR